MRTDESDAIFWERVVDMPYVEAIVELDERRAWALSEKLALEAKGKTHEAKEFDLLLMKINSEIKRINGLRDRFSWRQAIVAVLGEDAYAQVSAFRIQADL